jgi:hypothetical protein
MSSVAVGLELPCVSERAAVRANSRTMVWAGRAATVTAALLLIPFIVPVLVLSALLVFPLIPLFVWISALSVSASAVGWDESNEDSEPEPELAPVLPLAEAA